MVQSLAGATGADGLDCNAADAKEVYLDAVVKV